MIDDIFSPLSVDTADPTVGDFTYLSATPFSVTFLLGAPSTDHNFDWYRLFYREGLIEPAETDLEHIEAFFDHQDYDGETEVTIGGLDGDKEYAFILYAYDTFGNSGKNTFITRASIIGVKDLYSGTPILGSPAVTIIFVARPKSVIAGTPILGSPAVTIIYAVKPKSLLSGTPLIGTPIARLIYAVKPKSLLSGTPFMGAPVTTFIYIIVPKSLLTQAVYLGKPEALLKMRLQRIGPLIQGTFIEPQLLGEYLTMNLRGEIRVPTLHGFITTI